MSALGENALATSRRRMHDQNILASKAQPPARWNSTQRERDKVAKVSPANDYLDCFFLEPPSILQPRMDVDPVAIC